MLQLLVLGGKQSVTVLTGRWCHDRRALGKTFWKPEDLHKHYRKHGSELVKYANRITNWEI